MPLNKVTADSIADGTVIAADIADGSITSPKIAAGAVTGNTLSTNIINANNIVDSAILGNDLADNVIRANNIVAGTITGNLIATGQITGNLLATNIINANNIVDATITGAKLTSATITGDKIGVGQITSNLFAAGAISTSNISSGNSNVSVTSANGNVTIGTAGSERMRITSAGDVGIGTSSPQNKLSVDVALNDTKGLVLQYSGEAKGGILLNPSGGEVRMGSINPTGTYFTTFYANNTERMRITSGGLLQFDSGYGSVATAYGCRAWVNFDGTGTPAIRASGNVSSITDGGTGIYTVNFTTAIVDTNYAVLGTCERDGSNYDNPLLSHRTRATGSVVINTSRASTDLFDMIAITIAIIR